MTQTLKRFGHSSHVGGTRRAGRLISNSVGRWQRELSTWLKSYKKAYAKKSKS